MTVCADETFTRLLREIANERSNVLGGVYFEIFFTVLKFYLVTISTLIDIL